MEPHPLSEKYPLMRGEKYALFKAHVRDHGQQEAVIRFEGKILDGRNRWRALDDLCVPVADRKVRDFEGTAEQAAVLVQALNLERRNLTPEEERKVRAELVREMHAKGMSQRAIAEAVGVSQRTVERDIKTQVTHDASPDTTREPEPTHEPAPRTDRPPEGPRREHPPQGDTDRPAGIRAGDGPPGDRRGEGDVGVSEPPPSGPAKVMGRDGKQYAASRPKRTPAPRGAKQGDKAHPLAPQTTPWSDVAAHLDRLSALIAGTGEIPQEMKPWQVIESLEHAARSLLQRARELRRRHRLK